MSKSLHATPSVCRPASVSQAPASLPEEHAPNVNLHSMGLPASVSEEAHYAPADKIKHDGLHDTWGSDFELDDHPYAVQTRLYEEEHKTREIQQRLGRQSEQLEFSTDVTERGGNFERPQMFLGSQGSIEAVAQSNKSEEYRLIVSTCGQLAPGWVLEPYYEHPMWILDCPDLPSSHIEGSCFFNGLANNIMNSRYYTRENNTIGISYLTWPIGKFETLSARLDGELLSSLGQADRISGEICIAIVGRDSCTVVAQPIPAGLLDHINSYETVFAKTRNTVCNIDQQLVRDAEASISDEMTNSFRPPKILRVIKWPAAMQITEGQEDHAAL